MTKLDQLIAAPQGPERGEAIVAYARSLETEVIRHRVRALTNGAEARIQELEAALKTATTPEALFAQFRVWLRSLPTNEARLQAILDLNFCVHCGSDGGVCSFRCDE